MKITPFAVEEWMNTWENGALYNIAETCVYSLTADELFSLAGVDRASFLDALCSRRLTYGHIEGLPELKSAISGLYATLGPEDVITTHGGSGANHHVFWSLIEPGDRVISVIPTYQQLYSIPESLGARVNTLHLREEDGWLPNVDRLRRIAATGVRMICINNPNNPTGAQMSDDTLKAVVEIAAQHGAWLLCDEVYRGLSQDGRTPASIADLYERGISIGSVSKAFSLAGLRLGWIAVKNAKALKALLSHRDYDLISCGVFDEALAAVALKARDAILSRNNALLRTNLALLDEWVRGQPHLSWVKPSAGTTALIRWDYPIDSYDFAEELYRRTGAFVTPGDCFGEKRSIRIGFGQATETLRGGLNAMSEYIRQLEAEI